MKVTRASSRGIIDKNVYKGMRMLELPVDNTAGTHKDSDDGDEVLRSEGAEGNTLDNQSPSKDVKDKFNAGKLQLVDKAYEATELICEEPVPLSPIPEADSRSYQPPALHLLLHSTEITPLPRRNPLFALYLTSHNKLLH